MDEPIPGVSLKDYSADVRVLPEDINSPAGRPLIRTYDKIPSVGGVRGTKSSMASTDQTSDVGFAVTVDSNTATIIPGYVRSVNPKSDAENVITDWMPDGLDADPAPEYAVSAGQCIYALVNTDKRGEPTSVSIVVDSADKASTHYQPPPDDPNDVSADGEYYYKIAQIVSEGGVLVAKQHQIGGPIVHTASLWEGKNVGDGEYRVYKQIDPSEATFDFRTIKQEGLSITGAIGVLKAAEDPPGDIIPFRAIAARPSQMQINVELSGTDAIIIKGNDYDQTITLPGGGSIKTTDGLVESMVAPTSGGTFKLEVYNHTIIFNTGSNQIEVNRGSSPHRTIYFMGGIATTTQPAGFPSSPQIIAVAWITNDGGDGYSTE